MTPPPRSTRACANALACAALAAAGALALSACGDSGGPSSASGAQPTVAQRSQRSAPTQLPVTGAGQTNPTIQAADTAALHRIAQIGLPVYCAPRKGNMLALTFDDGPGPYTAKVLRKLRKHHASATFFLVGKELPTQDPTLPRSEAELGAVADHSFTHPLLTSLSPAAAREEIARAQQAVEQASGTPIALFRPPYGGRNAAIDAIASSLGMAEIIWSTDSRDSLGANYAQIAQLAIAGMHPGAIILMHENRGQTVRALLQILPALSAKHLHAVPLTTLLAEDPPDAAFLRRGPSAC